ncbi:MAG: SH3 domain-containing protein [Leptolyngbya sp. DLM2.Bin27]|nr:MAG: SH3 domain-containing protein [Leptolyngbya sp. DLM2.Bin27]
MAFMMQRSFRGAMALSGRFLPIALLLAGSFSAAPALAQDTRPLTENPTLIRGCRQLNRNTEIFDNSTLGPLANRIGTLGAGTQVTLTGAVATGRAQVFLGTGTLSAVQPVGWLNAANLGPCTTTPPPPTAGACFRADQNLIVRSGPSTTAGQVASYARGNTVVATTNPATEQTAADGRRWVQVRLANGGTGWVSRTGTGGLGSNMTPIPCP